jgi:hypothetical protein
MVGMSHSLSIFDDWFTFGDIDKGNLVTSGDSRSYLKWRGKTRLFENGANCQLLQSDCNVISRI